jgi:hypothetical protein
MYQRLAFALFAFVLAGCNWFRGFTPDPRLHRLLVQAGDSISHPVVAPDGINVYYIKAHQASSHAYGYYEGEIFTFAVGDSLPRMVIDGRFTSVAVSPSGSLLAVTDTCLLLVDCGGVMVDTVLQPDSSREWISDVEFSRDGSRLFYSVPSWRRCDYHRVNIDGSGDTLIRTDLGSADTRVGTGFDVRYDSIIVAGTGSDAWPKVNPLNQDIVVRPKNGILTSGLSIRMEGTDSAVYVDTRPLENATVGYPDWFPAGDKVIFCVGTGPGAASELWVLEDAPRPGN